MVFEATNKEAYRNYLRVFHRHLDFSALDVLHTTPRMCFMRVTVNRNKAISHKDVKDFRDGWAVMCCFGNFEGGELCLPTMTVETSEGTKTGLCCSGSTS